jgi:hypothetical protein
LIIGASHLGHGWRKILRVQPRCPVPSRFSRQKPHNVLPQIGQFQIEFPRDPLALQIMQRDMSSPGSG